MGELGRLIEQYQDEHWPRPSNAEIAARLHVARSSVGNWIKGTMPSPANLRALARLTGVPYPQILEAVLVDAGYKTRSGEIGGDTAAIARRATRARGRSARPRQHSEASPPPTADRPD